MSRQWPTMPVNRALRTYGAILLLLGITALIPAEIPTGEHPQTPRGESMEAFGPISEGMTVTQQFPASGRKIAAIAMELATYQRSNSGRFRITVARREGKHWRPLAVRSADKASLLDNQFFRVAFDPPLPVKPRQIVSVSITADGDAAQGIAWWVNPKWKQPLQAVLVNGSRQPGTARFMVTYQPKRGRVGAMLPQLWKRAGVFLNPFWRIVLAAAGLMALVGLAHLTLWSGVPYPDNNTKSRN